jgi:hypothetical protein
MTANQLHPSYLSDLRRRAEEKFRASKANPEERLVTVDTDRLVRELQVHQIELEMQNDELRRTQSELEASRSRYFDLYDLAPVGCFTLSENGLILEANITGANLLGVGTVSSCEIVSSPAQRPAPDRSRVVLHLVIRRKLIYIYTFFRIDKSRGSKVLVDVLGEEFNGVLGCDYFSAYRKYMRQFGVLVQFCMAHLIRDVKLLLTSVRREDRAYGQQLRDALRDLFAVIHRRERMTAAAFRQALDAARQHVPRTALIAVSFQNLPSLTASTTRPRARSLSAT